MKPKVHASKSQIHARKARVLQALACTILLLLGLLAPVASAQTITEIIDTTGDGAGNPLDGALGIALDGSGNVYVACFNSDNAFKITPGGIITEIIDATGDGAGNTLDGAYAIAVDGSNNVYVTGQFSDNAFKITPGGVITEIIDARATAPIRSPTLAVSPSTGRETST